MDKQKMRDQYKHAGTLFIMKEYEEALDILDELLEFVPGNRELLVAKAKCLLAMGFKDEARTLCNYLVSNFHDLTATTILTKLDRNRRKVAKAS